MKAVIYCRTGSSSKASIDNQERMCRKFAEENDYAVDKVFIEHLTACFSDYEKELRSRRIKEGLRRKKSMAVNT